MVPIATIENEVSTLVSNLTVEAAVTDGGRLVQVSIAGVEPPMSLALSDAQQTESEPLAVVNLW
jgi:hypothetical protein